MTHGPHLLAIDQGTTSTRALVFDLGGRILAGAQRELQQHFPGPGRVEHDADEIWGATLDLCRQAAEAAPGGCDSIAALGITNQRETLVVWDRASGRPLARAIVWQDRRTAETCRRLVAEGHEALVQGRTGLLLDPYFTGTKLGALLAERPELAQGARDGRVCFGTVESYLLFRLSGGAVHATDATNASRTLLMDLRTQHWDAELCALFGVPIEGLPAITDNAGALGVTAPGLFPRALAVTGMAGDQQAALVGQACLAPGMVKSTYGTGAFALLHTGDAPMASRHRLITTLAHRVGGRAAYALEGAIFVAGAAVQWLRDGLGLIRTAAETEAIARATPDSGGVYVVPAFVGLGAPYWDPDARGAILGLERATSAAQIVRATLEAQAFQTRDLLDAMAADAGVPVAELRVDGGMVVNDWVCQGLADLTGVPVARPVVTETTALGAALLAAVGAELVPGLDAAAALWRQDRIFTPGMAEGRREALYGGWRRAVARVRTT